MTKSGFYLGIVQKDSIIDLPGLVGRLVVEKVFPSYNRNVFLAHRPDEPSQRMVVKTFNFNGGTVSTSEAEAQAVEKAIRLYRIALDKIAHVPVTSGIGFSNYTMPDGTTILIQVEPYMGRTCSRGLSEFRTKLALDLVEAICRQVILPCFLNATDLDDMKMV